MPRLLAAVLLCLVCAASAEAQAVRRDTTQRDTTRRDTTQRGAVRTDSTRSDTLRAPGALPASVDEPLGIPRAPAAEGGLDRPVEYTARDSVRIRLAARDSVPAGERPADEVVLYGEVRARSGEATIASGVLRYLAARDELRAEPRGDSADVGVPVFAEGEQTFTGRLFVYNLSTRRGRVTQARTAVGEGYLLGAAIKQKTDRVVFAQNVAYTTCSLDHPHYALEAGRIKVEDGKRVYSGPVRLKLLGITLPVVLPFGYFPTAEGRRSGPLAIQYGQESGFGLYLSNLGWYWALSDYTDLQVSGKVGTQGSFQAGSQFRYARRYAYSGGLSLDYGKIRRGESTDPTFSTSTPVGVRWTHNQTFPSTARLTAAVDLKSQSRRLVATDVGTQIQQSSSSSVEYSQNWAGVGRSLSVSTRAYQDFANNRTTVTLPTLDLRQQRRFPFRRGRDDHWYESVSVEYSGTATNSYDYAPLAKASGPSFLDALFDLDTFRAATGQSQRFTYQVDHRVPVQASIQVPRYNLSLTPSVVYTEAWRDRREARTYVAARDSLAIESVPGFTAVRRAAANLSLSTELFGTFPVRFGAVDGVRHTIRPSATLSVEPDYARFGYVREVQVDSTGRTSRYAVVPGVPTSPTQSLSFSVENAFLARTVREDSTGEVQRRTNQFLSLSLGGGYNFAALERPLQDLRLSFRTEFLGASASGNASLSAYALDERGLLLSQTVFGLTGRPLRLADAGVRVSRSFQSRRARGEDVRPVAASPLPGEGYDPTSPVPRQADVGYVDYAAPWSFSLDLTVFHRPGVALGGSQTTAALSVNQFNVRLTPNWTATGSTGLDLLSARPTLTSIGLRRDLHCWEMAVSWQPIGVVRGFTFSLYVKSGYLRDFLRLDVPRSVVRTLPF